MRVWQFRKPIGLNPIYPIKIVAKKKIANLVSQGIRLEGLRQKTAEFTEEVKIKSTHCVSWGSNSSLDVWKSFLNNPERSQ